MKDYLLTAARPLLTRDEERTLTRKVAAGDQRALDNLVRSNIRLVASVVKGYQDKGVCREELMAAGALGLVKAAFKFDPDLGNKFGTYATWWIQCYVRKALKKKEIVHHPAYLEPAMYKIRSIEVELGREMSVEEIAKSLDVEFAAAERVRAGLVSLSYAHQLGPHVTGTKAIQAEDHTCDIIKEQKAFSQKTEIRELMECLTVRERYVISRCYGVDGDPAWTLQKIASLQKVCPERARQIRNEALRKMRAFDLERKERASACRDRPK